MTRTTHLLAGILAITLLSTCSGSISDKEQKEENKPPFIIEVEKARNERQEVFLSNFASEIEYIHPETTEESLIGGFAYVYPTADYIVSAAFRQILVFDRKTGDFIREIRQYGQGPDEYRNTYPYLHLNERHQTTYVKDNRNKVLGLNAAGESRVVLQLPMEEGTFVNGFAQLEPDLFVGFHSNYDCKQDVKLVLFNRQGEAVKTYKNHLVCVNDDPNRISFDFTEGIFYNWNKQVFFKEDFNDTLFRVNRDTLMVQAIFNNGEHSLPYKDKTSGPEDGLWDAYYTISHIDETRDYIFFNMSFRGEMHSAYYDKVNNITKLAYLKNSESHRFSNDLDNFLPFRPVYATEDNKLVGYMEAPEIIEWFEENPEKAAKLPASLKQFENLKEDDNPVVMIVSLKD